MVESPASVPLDVAKEASRVAEQAIGSLEGAGVFGVELFLMSGGRVSVFLHMCFAVYLCRIKFVKLMHCFRLW